MPKTFRIGGMITINRLGFGAMQITGPGVWGPPRDKAEAIKVLRRLPELGINFIDTADSYGPNVSEQLLRETLHPYSGLLIATKAGFTRSGPNMWHVNCRPEHSSPKPITAAASWAWSKSDFGNCTVSTCAYPRRAIRGCETTSG